MADHPIIPIHTVTNLQTFEQCPRKYYATYVSHVKSVQTEEMAWGNLVHKALERHVKYSAPLPEGMTQFAWAAAPFLMLKQQGFEVNAEQNMAVRPDLTPVDYWSKTEKILLRGKTDVDARIANEVLIADYKTGKPKNDDTQLNIMAMLKFASDKSIDTIKAMFIWLKHDKTSSPVIYHREPDYDRVLHDIWPRLDRVEYEFRVMKFYPNPGPLCGWCHITACEYWEDRRG